MSSMHRRDVQGALADALSQGQRPSESCVIVSLQAQRCSYDVLVWGEGIQCCFGDLLSAGNAAEH